MYKTAFVVSVTGTAAAILFTDINIQTTADIMADVTVAAGDTAVVLYQADYTNCLIIGMKEQ